MKIWLTTDTHLSHARMIEFGRPPDYEDRILKNFSVVKEDDLLIHLGDICIGRDEYNHKRFFDVVKCKSWLIKGNHDKKSFTWYMNHGWSFVGEQISLRFGGRDILISHRPVDMKDSLFEINIHGHLHDNIHRIEEHSFFGPKNHLLALERTNYQPVLLENILTDFFRVPKLDL
jgi:calcineurin-like phosphoesterase family protein